MRKYPKIVQCDARGQIVIPKDVRQELGIDEGSAFWMYSVTDEGILLKMVPREELSDDSPVIAEIREKADRIKKKKVVKSRKKIMPETDVVPKKQSGRKSGSTSKKKTTLKMKKQVRKKKTALKMKKKINPKITKKTTPKAKKK